MIACQTVARMLKVAILSAYGLEALKRAEMNLKLATMQRLSTRVSSPWKVDVRWEAVVVYLGQRLFGLQPPSSKSVRRT